MTTLERRAASAEAPSAEALSPEAPSAEALSPEAPSAEALSPEAPSAGAPSAEAPSSEDVSWRPRFDNAFLRELPVDADARNTRREVQACSVRVRPASVPAPALVAYSPEVASLLAMPEGWPESRLFAEVFAGNQLLEGMDPYATCYGGHQFGHWAGQLGDGRAIALGQARGADGQLWELQLKGAGATPFSRMGDGRAVLRSSVREFLCSEAMHHLGVPTTRALSLLTTGDEVVRDMFYDGHARPEPGAVVCRVAPTFLRFGHYELPAVREDVDTLKKLCDHAIAHHFPQLDQAAPNSERYVAWLGEVCRATARLVVEWMRVGFVHGVLNTDNMSILGLTIDYGPYGWLEGFDPDWTPNTTDASGRRYRFGHQPQVAFWNLTRFAGALVPLIGDPAPLEKALTTYVEAFETGQRRMLEGKLGVPMDSDPGLAEALFSALEVAETDYTIFFRALADVPSQLEADASDEAVVAPLLSAYYAKDDLRATRLGKVADWVRRYAEACRAAGSTDAERQERMKRINPKYVLRNYLAQVAIDRAEAGDPSEVLTLLDLLRRPYDEQPERARYAERRPEWARHRAGCSMLSCSS